MGRFPLQVCTVVLSIIPIITGGVTLLELLGAPLFIHWQYRVAQAFATP